MPTQEKKQDANPVRRARLFRNGRNQAVRIPKEFEFSCGEVLLRREDGRLVIEPVPKRSRLLEVLAQWEPLDEEFPDIDEGLPPLDDVNL
jgi:antitoxin VapB